MARQSIVDFYKDAKTPLVQENPPGRGAPGIVAQVADSEAELAYVQFAGPVLAALKEASELAAGELFKKVDATGASRFFSVLHVMEARGLVRAKPMQGSDPIYTLA